MKLMTLNPWWENKEAIFADKHIRQLSRHKYVFKPDMLNYKFRTGNLYSIRGPRQIGKTTFLKQLVQKLLTNIPGKEIFYWSCDNLSTKDDLIEILQEYSEFCQINECKPQFILLDEITGLKDWQKAIKFVIDNDILTGCFILTGSNAIDLKKGTERLPGRRGRHGKDLFYMPLQFRDYVRLIDPGWYENHKKDSDKHLKHDNKLRLLFHKYLRTGGIPLVINEYEKYKEIPNYIYDLYYSWVVGDILKEGKNEQTLKEIMKSVLISYSTPVSWDSIAKRTAIKSHITVSSYMEILSSLLVLFSAYFFDVHTNEPNYNKNKKIYYHDPFILDLFSKRLNINVDISKIVEGIVASTLKKTDILGDIHFTKIKKETDFVIGKSGIEVKYRDRISSSDFINKRYFKNFTILSKDTFDKNVIPVHVFLFLDR